MMASTPCASFKTSSQHCARFQVEPAIAWWIDRLVSPMTNIKMKQIQFMKWCEMNNSMKMGLISTSCSCKSRTTQCLRILRRWQDERKYEELKIKSEKSSLSATRKMFLTRISRRNTDEMMTRHIHCSAANIHIVYAPTDDRTHKNYDKIPGNSPKPHSVTLQNTRQTRRNLTESSLILKQRKHKRDYHAPTDL